MNPHYQQVREEIRQLDDQISLLEKQAGTLRSKRDRLLNGIEKYNLRSQDIPVSDHALVRYLERVHNIDVAALKRHLLSPAAVTAITLGGGKVRGEDFTLVVNSGEVATVV